MHEQERRRWKGLLALFCIAALIFEVACCSGPSVRKRRVFICNVFTSYKECCWEPDLCPLGYSPCDFDPNCQDEDFPCDLPHIESLSPKCIERHGQAVNSADFKITGTALGKTIRIVFTLFDDDHADSGITVQPGSIQATYSQVTAKINIAQNAAPGKRRVSIMTSDGTTSNDRDLQVDGCPSASALAEMMPLPLLQRTSTTYGLPSGEPLFVQSLPAGSLVLTPVADGTVMQANAASASGNTPQVILTTGPASKAKNVQISGTPVDLAYRGFALNFQRFGLTTGGVLHVSGTTNLEGFAGSLPVPASHNASLSELSFGSAGVVEFDLSALKAALQDLNLSVTAVRASLRLTPIRSLHLSDFLTASAPPVPTTTQVVLLDMGQEQKDLVVDYNDFPGFTSPRASNLETLATTITNAPSSRRATVRTDLLDLLAPLDFDVTAAVQRDLQADTPATGFQIASQLNGAGLIFGDSSNLIPGLSESSAPQLIIELDGFRSSAQAQFVTSTTRIPFDYLPQGFTDVALVTVNNIGGSSGSVALELTAGANVFGLMTTDGRLLDTTGNTAQIAASERLTFAVSFKPTAGDMFQGELQISDITSRRKLIGKLVLTGTTLPADFSAGMPTITAPIRPQPLPDYAARVGDLNRDGLIDAVDVAQLSGMVAGRLPAPSAGTVAFAVADINGDGAINAADTGVLSDALTGNLAALPRLKPEASLANNGMHPLRRGYQKANSLGSVPQAGRTGVGVQAKPR